MVLVRVRGGGGEESFQFARVHLAQMLGERQDLMSGILHGAGFMDGDMPGLHGDGAFIVREHRGDDRGVGLFGQLQASRIFRFALWVYGSLP